MNTSFHLFPERASVNAGQVDALVIFLLLVSAFFILLIAGLIVFFAFRYRRKPADAKYIPPATDPTRFTEVIWIFVPCIILVVLFVWGTRLYITQARVPDGAMNIFVVGKQWMWKIQHEEGHREINALHVPLGRPVKLTMTSEDVIHDFGLPAFRLKKDVIPGRYTTEWFTATRLGEYHLFCDQYCGAGHTQMIGTVYVMDPAKYEAWLASATTDKPPAASGEKLFTSLGCATCHSSQAPSMAGLYMSRVHYIDLGGRPGTAIADDNFIREKLLDPRARATVGYQGSLMPTFAGRLSEEQIVQIIAYIKSMQHVARPPQATGPQAVQPSTLPTIRTEPPPTMEP